MDSALKLPSPVCELAADSGPLKHATGRPANAGEPLRYEVIEFIFERGTLRLSANVDTDEILVEVRDVPSDLPQVSHADASFASLEGKVVEYAWAMMNHRGYMDAFQVRWLDLSNRSEACLQFEVVASDINVRRVEA